MKRNRLVTSRFLVFLSTASIHLPSVVGVEQFHEVVVLLKEHELLSVCDVIAFQCLWLVVKETVCRQSRNHAHDEIVD